MLLYQCPQTNPQRVLGQRVTGRLGARSNRVSCPKSMVVINCGIVAESTISNVTNDGWPKVRINAHTLIAAKKQVCVCLSHIHNLCVQPAHG